MCNRHISIICRLFFFFFNDTATTEIYTLSLHDALPISLDVDRFSLARCGGRRGNEHSDVVVPARCAERSEEHTSELQSQSNLVCRLLLEKKKKTQRKRILHPNHQHLSPSRYGHSDYISS